LRSAHDPPTIDEVRLNLITPGNASNDSHARGADKCIAGPIWFPRCPAGAHLVFEGQCPIR
jgi:hypothetical protein